MHHFTVNASIQVIPVSQKEHPYKWVDEAISAISKSNVQYEVGPFATVLEGDYADVMRVVNEVNEMLWQHGCEEWITSLQIQIRNDRNVLGIEKTSKYKK